MLLESADVGEVLRLPLPEHVGQVEVVVEELLGLAGVVLLGVPSPYHRNPLLPLPVDVLVHLEHLAVHVVDLLDVVLEVTDVDELQLGQG